MGIKLDIDKAIRLSGYNGKFKNDLKKILKYQNNDSRINDHRELAYLLATAEEESGYSLERWEADYLCGNVGVAYKNSPCQSALNYYASTSNGKTNYYNLGVDSNGLPYFGRGLIQLTGKANYISYGKKLNIPLSDNADLALSPKNSYNIAVQYMKDRGTFTKVLNNDLTSARKTVGGSKALRAINDNYYKWLKVIKESKKDSIIATIISPDKKLTPEQKTNTIALSVTIGVIVVISGIGLYIYRRNK